MKESIAGEYRDHEYYYEESSQSENYATCKCGQGTGIGDLDYMEAEDWHANHVAEKILTIVEEPNGNA